MSDRDRPSALDGHLGVYRRVVRASLARVWENVLDWEHLPWLHGQAFSSIDCRRSGRDGWRATVGMTVGGDAEIDVQLDRPSLRYLTRTVSGVGAGTEIETVLTPRGDRATGIEVTFRHSGIAASDRRPAFELLRALYAELWDQDEDMMRHRQRVLDSRGAPPRMREAIVEGRRCAFSVSCPHLGGPLEESAVENGVVVCPWHGYRFDVRTGACVSGHAFRLEVRGAPDDPRSPLQTREPK